MTREERMDALREAIDTLGALGCLKAQRLAIVELAREYDATTPEQPPKAEAWERHLSEYELAQAQRKAERVA